MRPYLGPIPTCRCMALMRARWTRDRWPQAYVCTRCGLPVPKYERLWMRRQKEMEKEQQG